MQAVLNKIKPSAKERARLEGFVSNLVKTTKEISSLDCVVCGSTGKNTWLSGDHDIDLFILFPKTTPRNILEEKGLYFGKVLAAKLKGTPKLKYAEHPYTRIKIKEFEVDAVPCYEINYGDKIISAVDRSPLHLKYINEKLNPERVDEVRLLKQFCKGIGVYGSDVKNQGFSGYICELLILVYGSFESVLKKSISWQAPQYIYLEESKNKFHDQPLIIIDPTDTDRNAAANVNSENFIKFIYSAKKYLEKPSLDSFFPIKKQLSKDEIKNLKERETKFICLQFKKPDIVDDNLYPQLRRSIDRIMTILKHNEFSVLRAYEYVNNNAIIIFEFETWLLPKIKKMTGPPVFSSSHFNEFIEKYKSVYIEDFFVMTDKKREFQNVKKLLEHIVSLPQIEMEKIGIPGKIAVNLRKAKVLDHERFWHLLLSDKNLSVFLHDKYYENVLK